MKMDSRLSLPLVVSLVALQACSTAGQRYEDTQPAAQVDTVTPVATAAMVEAPSAPVVAVPIPAPVAEATPAAPTPAPVETSATPAFVDRYTVLPGDTLAGIAAKKEVYGDLRLWPLLYRANVQQIGPQGLIFPNQVLVVSRNYTLEDVNALIARPKKVMSAAKPAAVPPSAVGVAAATAGDPPAESKLADAKPPETKPVEPKPTEPKPAPAGTAGKPVANTATPPAGDAPKGAPAAGPAEQPADYLAGARRAFAAGDAPWAVYYYSVYLEQKYNDANAWGELGNVHYFDGNLAEAAKAYYNAANLLIDRGQTGRALSLIPAIEEGDPGLSEALHQRLTTIKR